MQAELHDFYIRDLIKTARYLLKIRREWLNKYGDISLLDAHKLSVPPCPDSYYPYLLLKHTITAAMKHRRQHRKNVAHVWQVYADSIIKARG